ncbi:MAG: transcription termination/antitermination protein NusA [Bacilli bacterium]|nr:transcription termination/antitermination protein NusA [Bacilli bacterium]
MKALNDLAEEKGIDKDVIFDAMELALTSAYKKNYHSLSNVRVDINRETGDIKIFSYKTVVFSEEFEKEDGKLETQIITDEDGNETEVEKEFYFDDRIHITLENAQKKVPGIKIGETIEKEVTPKDFGRVAASTAKQVVIQKIREAEREIINSEFEDKEGEMITGVASMEDQRNYYIELGRTQGILPKKEIIPGEKIQMGSSIKAYITKVENGSKGPIILLSRKHYGFVKRLFELDVPEINEGIILVYSVAREAGNRTKIAVYSENPNVEAVGSCIGERGSRINNIIKELNGEKIDVVKYESDPSKFIENALSPAKDLHIFITDEKKRKAMAIVNKDNLSLAIGKKGLNVRLASRLTHYTIDVLTIEEAKEKGISIVE